MNVDKHTSREYRHFVTGDAFAVIIMDYSWSVVQNTGPEDSLWI